MKKWIWTCELGGDLHRISCTSGTWSRTYELWLDNEHLASVHSRYNFVMPGFWEKRLTVGDRPCLLMMSDGEADFFMSGHSLETRIPYDIKKESIRDAHRQTNKWLVALGFIEVAVSAAAAVVSGKMIFMALPIIGVGYMAVGLYRLYRLENVCRRK